MNFSKMKHETSSECLVWVNIFLSLFILRERERVCREKNLHAVNAEPDTGHEPTNCEIMT